MPPSNSDSDLRRSPELQEVASAPTTTTVQVKTENGDTKTMPMYKSGTIVFYENRSIGKFEEAQILSVHQDDLLEPYYSIRLLSDGREKQTDNAHLRIDITLEDDEDDIVTEAGEPEEDSCSIATEKAEDNAEVVHDSVQETPGPCCCIVY